MRRHLTVLSLMIAGSFNGGCASDGVGNTNSPSALRGGTTPETQITRPDRPAHYTTCPSSGIEPPPPMVLVDRSLPNLGTGFLGRVDTYDAGATRLEIAVGVHVLAEYDDLDFHSKQVSMAGRTATLSTAGAFGTDDRLVILTWFEPTQDAPCAPHALVGTNLPPEMLIELAGGAAAPPSES